MDWEQASLALGFALVACDRRAPSTPPMQDAPASSELSVRVPGALEVARAIDTLSVSIDPTSLADTRVTADAGWVVGIESDSFVFPIGGTRPALGRHGLRSGADFDLGTSTWSVKTDGVPLSGTRYVAEVHLVLFETDVPNGHDWAPHAGRYRVLWERTLRQAEE